MNWLNTATLAIFSYFLGSFPSGYWLGRWVGNLDIRTVGSGNIGATNVARNLGLKWGVLVLLVDMAKGALPAALALHLWPPGPTANNLKACLLALAPFFGHCYSPFLHFRGGKGVATGFGAALVVLPRAAMPALAVFLITTWRWRYVSLASVAAALSLPFWAAIMSYHELYLGLCALFAFFIGIHHHDNIRALLQGEERKWE